MTLVPGESPTAAAKRFLAATRGILVLDNFEHLLGAAPLVSELLGSCPALRILATSREALQLQAEHRYSVAPLEVPENGAPEAVARAAAAALFVERASSRDRAFALTPANAHAIASVCRRVDGLPLAVELAAARMAVLDPDELDARLAQALDALGSGPRDAPARQRTLRATLEWSHRLLSAAEAEAFACFAAFAGGATVEAAEEVTGADLSVLEGLVEKNLLVRESGRLLMLETVRAYAHELLELGSHGSEARLRHCRHFIALAERATPHLRTHGEAEWIRRLDAETDNFRAALEWGLRHDEPALALRLAGWLGEYWELRNASTEGVRWLKAAIEAAGDEAPLDDRARALRSQALMLEEQGSLYDAGGSQAASKSVASEAVALSRRTGDPAGIAQALLRLSAFEQDAPDGDRLRALVEEALPYARAAGNDRLIADALAARALLFPIVDMGAEIAETAGLYRKVGDIHGIAGLYCNVGFVATGQGSYECAAEYLDEALPLAKRTGEPLRVIIVLGNLGHVSLFMSDLERAAAHYREALRLCVEYSVAWVAADGIGGLAAVAACRREPERAARLLGAAESMADFLVDAVGVRLERELFSPAREEIGEALWDVAYADGARLSFHEAVSLAMEPG
jgi:predicted ATPase